MTNKEVDLFVRFMANSKETLRLTKYRKKQEQIKGKCVEELSRLKNEKQAAENAVISVINELCKLHGENTALLSVLDEDTKKKFIEKAKPIQEQTRKILGH